jgi:putative membrane protein
MRRPERRRMMQSMTKQLFMAAVAACALIAFVSPSRAQDQKKEAALEGQDMKFFREMAQADLAEVQAGKMAQGKAQNDEVKKYAQHMVEDHGKKVAEARTLAKSKGVQMPSAPAKKHQDAAKKLEQASGSEFDRMFMRQMVKDHEEALKLAQQAAKSAKDKDLKAAAEKSVPVIEKHLEMAKTITSSLK